MSVASIQVSLTLVFGGENLGEVGVEIIDPLCEVEGCRSVLLLGAKCTEDTRLKWVSMLYDRYAMLKEVSTSPNTKHQS